MFLGVPQAGSTSIIELQGNPPAPTIFAFFPKVVGYTAGAPIVTTTGGGSDFIVWSYGAFVDALDGISGRDLGVGSSANAAETALVAPAHYFTPPIAANGRIVVATCGTCGIPSEDPPPPPNGPSHGQLVFFY